MAQCKEIARALLEGDADRARELAGGRNLWTVAEIRCVLGAGKEMQKKYPGCPGEAIARRVLWPQ